VTKEPLSLSASDWAQGGIAAAIAPDDSPTLHYQDTLQAGVGLCDSAAVEMLVEQAPQCIQDLVTMGVAFDQHQSHLALTLEAAHSRRRVLHAADTTGRAVVTALTQQVLRQPNIQVISGYVLDLWMPTDTDPFHTNLDLGPGSLNPSAASTASPHSQPCRGVILAYEDRVHWLAAAVVVLATGGGGQVFAQTTNPSLSTGDGVAMGWRAGALLRDLEFVQFHPTALTLPGAPRFLISEAVRGEGAHLIDDTGKRFADAYHPDGELAPRDVVSRAIFTHLQTTHPDDATAHVWLDLRAIAPDTIQRRFPNIVQVCQDWGVDPFQEPIPVAPAAHYWMGGVSTDLSSQTSIPHLYAVGETASTGVHGANRLASNSLLECIVFGAQLKSLSLPTPAPEGPGNSGALPPISGTALQLEAWATQQDHLHRLRERIAQLTWHSAGISRTQTVMEGAIAQLQTWRDEFSALPLSQQLASLSIESARAIAVPQALLRQWGETRNLLDIALLILQCAHFRTESRGGHYRADFPQTQEDWRGHTLVQQQHLWRSNLL
jgi:L-aspartate oxidase